jgi:hypothetical protein
MGEDRLRGELRDVLFLQFASFQADDEIIQCRYWTDTLQEDQHGYNERARMGGSVTGPEFALYRRAYG